MEKLLNTDQRTWVRLLLSTQKKKGSGTAAGVVTSLAMKKTARIVLG